VAAASHLIDEPDKDVRENIGFYDEEGAGGNFRLVDSRLTA